MGLEPINLFDYEAAAQRLLPFSVGEFIAAGAMDERVLARNRSAFDAVTLRPRYLRDPSVRNLATAMLGTEVSLPVFLAPAMSHTLAHPEGEAETARGAGLAETLMILSTVCDLPLERVAEAATGPLWFQLYHSDRAQSESLVHRAEAAGFRALCVTVDVPLVTTKERDRRSGMFLPTAGLGEGNFSDVPLAAAEPARAYRDGFPFTWQDLEWLRGLTSLPIVLKGIVTAEDARAAVDAGADAVYVSTHGGRMFDATPGALECLPEVVDAVGDQAEVYLDSGVRRGSDVLKALALGARAVGIGRPIFWGLAVHGAEGVRGVLDILRVELEIALAYCGQPSVRELEPGLVNLPATTPV